MRKAKRARAAAALYPRAASQSVALRTLLDDFLASRPIEVDAAPS
ncbi:hypothetical protein [Sorangium sp. So ce887]